MPAETINVLKEHRVKTIVRAFFTAIGKLFWPLLPKRLFLGERPTKIYLAMTRKCNANCVFCAYQHAPKSAKAHILESVFDRVIADVDRLKIPRIMISPNIGEPTIAPDFFTKIRRLRGAGVRHIEMTSNALYWHKLGIDRLLAEGPDQINISFAGFDEAMYERDFRVHHYQQTRSNVLSLIRRNHELGRPRKVQLWLRGDLPKEQLLAAPEITEIQTTGTPIQVMTEVDSWLDLISAESLPGGYQLQTTRPPLRPRPCVMLHSLTIHPDGEIQLCSCRNVFGDPDMDIGNISEISLAEAHARMPAAWKKWEQGHIPVSCQSCWMYNDPAYTTASALATAMGRLIAKPLDLFRPAIEGRVFEKPEPGSISKI
jgi:radical SAM protein with 4Fe4S-binding SPASM domain